MMLPLALIAGLLMPPDQTGFAMPKMTIVQADGGAKITVTLKKGSLGSIPLNPVPYTAEPVVVTASKTDVLDESNIFDSGLVMDIDGDGKTEGKIPIKCDGQDAIFGTYRAQPLEVNGMIYRGAAGHPKISRYGGKGAYIVLYRPCGVGTQVGFSDGKTPIRIKSLPGPVLQLNVLEIVDGPTAKATLTMGNPMVDGVQVDSRYARLHVHEAIDGPKPSWTVVHMFMIPLLAPHKTHTIKLNVKGTGHGIVAAAANVSPAKGSRVRGHFATQPLRLGK